MNDPQTGGGGDWVNNRTFFCPLASPFIPLNFSSLSPSLSCPTFHFLPPLLSLYPWKFPISAWAAAKWSDCRHICRQTQTHRADGSIYLSLLRSNKDRTPDLLPNHSEPSPSDSLVGLFSLRQELFLPLNIFFCSVCWSEADFFRDIWRAAPQSLWKQNISWHSFVLQTTGMMRPFVGGSKDASRCLQETWLIERYGSK